MGAFDKFRSADKLFWESSGRKIEKTYQGFIYSESECIQVLEKYYSQYGIDIFDRENIDRLLEFHGNIAFMHTNLSLYKTLKKIQINSTDYVTDYLSYETCLKKYYNIHKEDTEWLVKIFAERYDLDRFNISVEDVLDDVHKLMNTAQKSSNLKKNNSSTLNDNKSEKYIPSGSCTDKLEATMKFTAGYYFDVINALKEAPQTDFNVIVLASQSHLAVGNFVSAYNTLKVLFESNEPIYQLPYADKKKSFPFGYEIFEILKSLRINTWSDALKRENLFPIMPTALGKIKNFNHNQFAENCFYEILELSADIAEISMKECIDTLVKAEMAIELSWKVDKNHYQLKAMYLEKLLSYFANEPVDDVMDLWAKGLNDCLRMAK